MYTPSEEILERRAAGESLRALAPDAGVSAMELSRVFRKPQFAEQLEELRHPTPQPAKSRKPRASARRAHLKASEVGNRSEIGPAPPESSPQAPDSSPLVPAAAEPRVTRGNGRASFSYEGERKLRVTPLFGVDPDYARFLARRKNLNAHDAFASDLVRVTDETGSRWVPRGEAG